MQFSVRPAVVARLLGDMYGILALLTIVPGVLAWATESVAAPAYALVVLALGIAWLAARGLPAPRGVQKNEALVVVALVFSSSSLLLALPVMAYGIPFIDAWFEAVSGVTTTGLSTLQLADRPVAFLFGRAWMQWVGGIGVVVLALALFVRPGVSASRLGFSRQEMDDVVGGTRAHARRVIIIYLGLTLLGISALLLAGASLIDAIVHCMAALSTGGFANYQASLASVSASQLWVINALCIAGAVSFHLYYRSLLYTRRGQFLDSQLYALLALLLLLSSLLWALGQAADLDASLADLATLAISAQTTAGFSTVDLATLPPAMLLLLCAFMAIGGGAGSTAGGIKLDRALVVLQVAYRALLRSSLPEKVYVRGEKGAEASRLEEAVALVFWFLLFVLLSWLVFLACGYPAMNSLFEVVSATATVGLSAGVTSADLPPALKALLCFNMLLGRVEIVAMLVLFAPRSWFGRRRALNGRTTK
ncbi:TrkH family potassium uptake protein [Seongchinamella sediminis]|uniref:TrkH family potassium uptake protein n=2 Tax=Seongchinamella sediminis TaxID=2283635 RepID=A0A3L7DSW7_9GAMM|nr:TrkH family potassium uptake protein [Seongchinamella sediminis]